MPAPWGNPARSEHQATVQTVTESLLALFLASLREGIEASALLLLIRSFLRSEDADLLHAWLLAGFLLAALIGFPLGYFALDPDLGRRSLWVFSALVAHSALYFGSALLIGRPLPSSRNLGRIFAGTLGFTLFFFETGALASVMKGTGLLTHNMSTALATGSVGLATALSVYPLANRFLLRRVDFRGIWSLSSLLLTLGALRLATGGLDEFMEQNLIINLQLGVGKWLTPAVRHLQNLLLIEDHLYLARPLTGLMDYLAGDRLSMTVMLLIVFFPPVWILTRLVAAPDPDIGKIHVGSERRMTVARFRRDLSLRGSPMMFSFLLIVFLVHAANLSLNPLLDPRPVPVTAEEGTEEIRIPIADSAGDFSDMKIRKYVYFHGDRKIVFIAIQRPDGLIATALDECEICRPAAWNTKAIGYAQRGQNLVCKYCVTPISAQSVGEPGGCNPIPFESRFDDRYLYVPLTNLIETWNAAQKIEKAGTHL